MTSKIVVNNIEADAGISSVTLNSNIAGEDSTQNISGINSVTATTFHGSGANLTSLPAQATIANNADNRVITGGSGVNLNGEANLTFDGSTLSVNGVLDVNVPGTQFNGGTGNASGTDAVVYIDKETNNDWCLKLKPNQGSSTNYGLLIEAENATSQAFVIRNSDDSNNSQFYINGEGDYFTGNSYPRSDGNKDLGYHSGYKWRDVVLSGGVRFGTANASDYLDDYEEGDHTTTVTMSGDTSFSYNARTLAYTKIGRVVHITGRINISGAGGSSFRFTLPYTCGDNSFKYETSNEFQNIRFNDGYTFRIRANTAYADLQNDGSDTGIGTNDPHINVSLTYFTTS